MKIYYFNEIVTLIREIKEFNVAKIKLSNGQEIYVNLKLLSPYKIHNQNVQIKI